MERFQGGGLGEPSVVRALCRLPHIVVNPTKVVFAIRLAYKSDTKEHVTRESPSHLN
jgi:hypothetical protein